MNTQEIDTQAALEARKQEIIALAANMGITLENLGGHFYSVQGAGSLMTLGNTFKYQNGKLKETWRLKLCRSSSSRRWRIVKQSPLLTTVLAECLRWIDMETQYRYRRDARNA